MTNIIPFNYDGIHGVRAITDSETWFVARDVCDILGLSDVSKSVSRLDDDEKGTKIIPTPGGNQIMLVINEPGLYSLILTSNKPEAKEFKRWITHEVIPQIRKTGSYSLVPKTFAEALRLAADLEEERQILIPKAQQYDTFMDGSNNQDMKKVAKTLGWGRNNLFKELRSRDILMEDNTPYQDYINRGYFEVKQKPIKMGDASINKAQTFVTSKGIDWLAKILKSA